LGTGVNPAGACLRKLTVRVDGDVISLMTEDGA
jgi:hypothetical protein